MRKLLLWLNAVTAAITYARADGDEHADLHPMLYFNKSDISRLRIEASFSHRKISRNIFEAGHALKSEQWRYLPPKDHKTFTSVWNEKYGNNLCAFSFYCVLNPDDRRAFELVRTYLDRMTEYENWYVDGIADNDVGPLSHIVTGFATAYDFLYERFDLERKKLYYNKIKAVTSEYSKIFDINKFEFMRQHTHSQVASNVFGFLLGALIVSSHEPKVAAPWLQKSRDTLDFTLELLSYVVDGSTSEGVSYGSYTSRSLTQYVYLAQRHFKEDHSRNQWLLQHFWFYYHTMLPGFQRTVGIADCNYNWLYGPESQIQFLDSHIMKTGYGNWLAEQIRTARVGYRPVAPSSTQLWSSHHTEFIFYNNHLSPLRPTSNAKSRLHIFSDWGVVTYGGSQASEIGNTYFSFKSGTPGGEAARDIIHNGRYRNRIEGWENFKPGHEHPDQNSFVFIPNGRYVISEALHGPKMTYLENTIVFSPSPTSLCNQPFEGQLGECERWLKYDQYVDETTRGEILTASSVGSMAFVSGEAVGMYSKELKLSSVQRSVLLYNPEVLIVLDSILLQRSSPIKRASAFFHNIWTPFKPYKHLGYDGAKVEYPEGDYSFFSVIQRNQNVNVSIHNGVKPDGLKEGPTNYVNVTFDVMEGNTKILHCFHGPTYHVENITVDQRAHAVIIRMSINGKNYETAISTLSKSAARDVLPVTERRCVTGYSGYASVIDSEKTSHFGFANQILKLGKRSLKRVYSDKRKLTLEQQNTLPHSMAFTSSFDDQFNISQNLVEDANRVSSIDTTTFNSTFVTSTRVNVSVITKTSSLPIQVKPDKDGWKLSVGILVVLLAIFIFFKVYNSSKRETLRRSTRTWQYLSRVTGFLLFCMIFINFMICIDENGRNTCVGGKRIRHAPVLPYTHGARNRVSLPHMQSHSSAHNPFIMITSLPGSGVDILEAVFGSANFLNYIPSSEINHAALGVDKEANPCVWRPKMQRYTMTELWLRSMLDRPTLHFNQQQGCNKIKHRLRQNGNAPLALSDNTGFWTTKLPWVSNIVGSKRFQPILVVRDPRSWIHMLLSQSNDDSEKTVSELTDTFERLYDTCNKGISSIPYYYQHFREEQTSEWHVPNDIEKLAMMWTVVMGTAMVNAANDSDTEWPLHIIRFEDILTKTEDTITNMFENMGFPLSIKALNKITRIVRTGHYSVAYDGKMNPDIAEAWKSGLADYDIVKIERICGGMMEVFGYDHDYFRSSKETNSKTTSSSSNDS